MSSAANKISTPSTFEVIFDAALAKYTNQTGHDLRNHPLALKIDTCDSLDDILLVFQAQVQAFDEVRNDDARLIIWLKPVVNTLHALSTSVALSTSISLVGSFKFVSSLSMSYTSVTV